MKKLILVIGVPASGKSWLCEQLAKKFQYVAKDAFIGWPPGSHVSKCIRYLRESETPVLTEAQFSISDVKDPIEEAGFQVIPVFVFENEATLNKRWDERGLKKASTRAGHISRQRTYAERARELRAFSGTSAQVLEHLKAL